MIDEFEEAFRTAPISQQAYVKRKIRAVLDIAMKDPSNTDAMHAAAAGITGYENTHTAAIDGKLYSLDIRDNRYVLSCLSDDWQIQF